MIYHSNLKISIKQIIASCYSLTEGHISGILRLPNYNN